MSGASATSHSVVGTFPAAWARLSAVMPRVAVSTDKELHVVTRRREGRDRRVEGHAAGAEGDYRSRKGKRLLVHLWRSSPHFTRMVATATLDDRSLSAVGAIG